MGRLLVVEDHALVREGMVQSLRNLRGVGDIVEAESADDALQVLAARGDFDLLLLDLGLPGVDGLSFLRTLRARYPKLPILVVSAHCDRDVIRRATRQGAAGFVPKSHSCRALLDAVRGILEARGSGARQRSVGIREDRSVSIENQQLPYEQFDLTPAQARVLDLLALGKTNREIAETLGLTEGTVKLHVTAILRALKVSNRAQALLAVTRADQRFQS